MTNSFFRNPEVGNVVQFTRIMERCVVEAPIWENIRTYRDGRIFGGDGKLSHIHANDTFLILERMADPSEAAFWYKILFEEGVWWLHWWDQDAYGRESFAKLEVIS